jgi:hypothetical protein
MSKRAFDNFKAGVEDAIARGEVAHLAFGPSSAAFAPAADIDYDARIDRVAGNGRRAWRASRSGTSKTL